MVFSLTLVFGISVSFGQSGCQKNCDFFKLQVSMESLNINKNANNVPASVKIINRKSSNVHVSNVRNIRIVLTKKLERSTYLSTSPKPNRVNKLKHLRYKLKDGDIYGSLDISNISNRTINGNGWITINTDLVKIDWRKSIEGSKDESIKLKDISTDFKFLYLDYQERKGYFKRYTPKFMLFEDVEVKENGKVKTVKRRRTNVEPATLTPIYKLFSTNAKSIKVVSLK